MSSAKWRAFCLSPNVSTPRGLGTYVGVSELGIKVFLWCQLVFDAADFQVDRAVIYELVVASSWVQYKGQVDIKQQEQ